MKIQCNVCETAEATVLCCADEAALCHDCDEKIHAANKLASKHQRVSLTQSLSQMPKCDICQEAVGYFFCIQDRALLCRKCDVAIHTANAYVSAHQRFLLTGVKVGLEPAEHDSTSSGGRTHSGERVSDMENRAAPKRSAPTSTTSQYDRSGPVQSGIGALMPSKRSIPTSVASEYTKVQPIQSSTLEDLAQPKMTYAGGSATANLSQWSIDEFLGMSDFPENYGFTESSKADSGKLGESDSSSFLRSWEDDLDSDDRLGQVPDVSWTVPQAPSPPTASGLFWPKTSQQLADDAVFVPDICQLSAPNHHQHLPNRNSWKRRRQF